MSFPRAVQWRYCRVGTHDCLIIDVIAARQSLAQIFPCNTKSSDQVIQKNIDRPVAKTLKYLMHQNLFLQFFSNVLGQLATTSLFVNTSGFPL